MTVCTTPAGCIYGDHQPFYCAQRCILADALVAAEEPPPYQPKPAAVEDYADIARRMKGGA